ncbi:MAG TPA: hypothetical protein VHQ64_02640 [Pyrinomonadaceae bacterium]|nr:hypothetical protein [Pyrinomonadaceae bacterium]
MAAVFALWQTGKRNTRVASTAIRLALSVACVCRRVVAGSVLPISDATVASLQPAAASLVPNVCRNHANADRQSWLTRKLSRGLCKAYVTLRLTKT